MKNSSDMHERFRQLSAPAPIAPAAIAPAAAVATLFEPQLIEILRRPVDGATSHEAHRRKEQEIGELFATLTAIEASTLHKRLSSPSATDALALAFGRLIVERRGRLLTFLGDARRRAATAQTKRAA